MNHNRKIFFAGNKSDLKLLEQTLKTKRHWADTIISYAASFEKTIKEVSVCDYHLLILDCSALNISILESTIRLKAVKKNLILILMNKPHHERIGVSCLKAGANYYLNKDQHWLDELPEVMELVIDEENRKTNMRIRLMNLEEENRQMKKNAILDQETLFYSSNHFETLLDREVRKAMRYNTKLACLIMNIPTEISFEKRNKILEKIALTIRPIIRSGDIWCRMADGGLAALLPHTSKGQAEIAVKRIHSEITTATTIKKNEKPKITWGLSVFDKNTMARHHDLLRSASCSPYTI
ncbi:MAG: hypothetical protein A3G32_07780 [Deltaproteobacteria bacterium RIFCSPLOWO2_12_FULL_40_28]|nr:MAG: hypothetical protein A3C45_00480 [Deltaproteobacteria bacterium RIFCSPHIGHO2_02_FULL_40_28]OGQ20813.1 MAG: hypothetical protein A3E27_03145 [Deltaproteobacteria bacterium RIFCSPHIGHO2_12_FULL_40_32]OGQ39214.1 MAG: hypothetical protein A3I69_04505 [Deltaproteobacteria bacterium RIFCSPLOWO2_02_FULL_40_36]OGQ54495.1 MAG: hypothetical protein A3G32_07780 [Deltaproteobacteria bacterium RIFCSPLOWO2_12_FULL_40_28]